MRQTWRREQPQPSPLRRHKSLWDKGKPWLAAPGAQGETKPKPSAYKGIVFDLTQNLSSKA